MCIENGSANDKKLDKTKMSENLYGYFQSVNQYVTKVSENQNDYSISKLSSSQSALGVNLIDEKGKLNNKIEHDIQEDNETLFIYACSMCPANFDEKSNLFIHSRRPSLIHFTAIHEETERLDCDICNSHFRCESELRRLVNSVHEKLKPFACKLCESTFSRKYAFK